MIVMAVSAFGMYNFLCIFVGGGLSPDVLNPFFVVGGELTTFFISGAGSWSVLIWFDNKVHGHVY